MAVEKPGYKSAVLKSIIVHAVILTGFAVAIQAPEVVTHFQGQKAPVVKATVIDPAAVEQAVSAMNSAHSAALDQAKKAKRQAEHELASVRKERLQTEKMLKQLKAQNQAAHSQRQKVLDDIAKAKQAQQASEKRLAQVRAAEKKAALQAQQNQAKLKKQIQALQLEKKKAEKALAEKKKRQLAEARKKAAAQEKAQERKRQEAAKQAKLKAAEQKAQAEAKRKAALEKLKASARASIANQLQAHEQQLAEQAAQRAQQKYFQSEFEKYQGLIVAKISNNWNQVNADPSLSVLIRVNLNLAGDILSVQVVRSSGDAVFDRQARLAVLSTGRLPLPPEKQVAKRFLSFQFHFTPQGIS